ncbi:MAG: hypothetical protein KF799_05555 [Bdellovibrionales bacterium]|nr:hypothetical protein [Bdellovibrionales bacterium]
MRTRRNTNPILAVLLALVCSGLPAFAADDLMTALDSCEVTEELLRGHLENAANILEAEVRLEDRSSRELSQTRRFQVSMELENVSWHKTRCVHDVVMRFLPPDESLRRLQYRSENEKVMTQLGLYRGLKTGASHSQKCKDFFDQKCMRRQMIENMQRQAVLKAIDRLAGDLYEGEAAKSELTLRQIAFHRLAEIDSRIDGYERRCCVRK